MAQRVRSEFIGRGKYKVLPQDTGVDAVLRATINNITLTPSGFNEAQQATRYVITISVGIQFVQASDNKVLWQNPSLVFREEYQQASGGRRHRRRRPSSPVVQRRRAHGHRLRPHRRQRHPRSVLTADAMPGLLTPAAVRAQIAAGTIEPLYLVTGDDEVEMSAIATALAESVDEDFRAFNVQRFYGSDAGSTLAAVLDAASTLPLLSPRRVVVLQQAERVLTARKGRQAGGRRGAGRRGRRRSGGGKAPGWPCLKEYAKHPHAHATVAIIGLGLGRTFEPLARQAAVVVCEASSDVIRRLEAEHGVRFDRDAAELLRQMAGADVARLRADVERVLLYAAGPEDRHPRARAGGHRARASSGRQRSGRRWPTGARRRR